MKSQLAWVFGKQAWGEVLFLLFGVPLGILWFTVLVTGWSVTLALAITPFVIVNLLLLSAVFRGAAWVESSLARQFLHIDVYPPHEPLVKQSLWRKTFGWLTDPAMWKAQLYLGFRAIAGFGMGLLVFVGLTVSFAVLVAPLWYWAPNGGPDIGVWHVDTLPKALAIMPAGAIGFVISMLLTRMFAQLNREVARGLFEHSPDSRGQRPPQDMVERRRHFSIRLFAYAFTELVLIIIWALTGHGYFWPIWPLLAFGLIVGANAVVLFVDENRELFNRPGMSWQLAIQIGLSGVLVLFQVGVWAASGFGNFWPVWTLLGLSIAAAVRSAFIYFSPPDQEELTQRIETLTTTRAGAVDQQEAELRRIERDLHDGAQARLVALGMSIGMAEQKMKDDPEGARELLEEARVGAGQALKELRDLARGIHPPVLADRGLEAAVTALADASPLRVLVHADIDSRPSPPVESAAYFVVAEALANAGKHSQAGRVDIRMVRDGDTLSVEVADDGVGGANPNGGGLGGLRRRIEALDGTLRVASPPGGPTLIRAEMPCG
ncbi:MAG TPA: sensor domain-containing protein [Thermoleophilaceae bacterium]